MGEVAPEFDSGTANAYSASVLLKGVPSLATDIFSIKGSASKIITIKALEITGTRTTAGTVPINLVKRSTASTGGGVSTLVQYVNATTVASSTTAVVTVASTGAGNLIVIGANNTDNRTITGITDGTTAFTQATNAAGGAGSLKSDIWYLLSSNSGKTTFTVTFSGVSTTKDLFFWEVSGVGAATFDNANRVNNGTVGATDTGAAVTAAGPSFIVGLILTAGTITANPAAGNEFSSGGSISSLGDAACSLITPTLATAHTPTWTDSGAGAFAASTAAFTFTGNTAITITMVPHDSTNAAATASVVQYAANPTVGTSVGTVRNTQLFVSTSSTVPTFQRWTFFQGSDQGITLRGTAQSFSVNLGGTTVAGAIFSINIEWEESL